MKRYNVTFKKISDYNEQIRFSWYKSFLLYSDIGKEDAEKKAKELLEEYMNNVISQSMYHRSAGYATYEVDSIKLSKVKEKFDSKVKSFSTKKKYVKSPMCPTRILTKFAKEEPKLHSLILKHRNTKDETKLEILSLFLKSNERTIRAEAAEHELLPIDNLETLCVDRDSLVRKCAIKNYKNRVKISDEAIGVLNHTYHDPFKNIDIMKMLESILDIKEEKEKTYKRGGAWGLGTPSIYTYAYYATATCPRTLKKIIFYKENTNDDLIIYYNESRRCANIHQLVMDARDLDFKGFLEYAKGFLK